LLQVSHAWANALHLLVSTVTSFLADCDSASTYVWIDCLAVNQHATSPQNAADVASFSEVLAVSKSGTIVVVDAEAVMPAQRAWCIYEWDQTLAHHGPDALHMPLSSPQMVARAVAAINVEKAGAFSAADKAMILEQVVKQHGSYAQFDAKLKLRIMLEPLSYKVDLELRSKRAGSADSWDMQPVVQWLAKRAEASRGVVVVAGAGTGKSTVSAMIHSHPALAGRVSAVHFFKYNDVARQDLVRVVS